ncbi:MAG: sigma-70 family RNA polymerase sigma factor [Cyanobacteria bacterium P01_D01_bin.44]
MGFDSSNQKSAAVIDATDEALIEAIKAKQVGALREIYRRYAGLVYTLALRILNTAEEAEDMTQEIFLTLWHQCRYDPSRGSLKRFLVMITRSRSIDRVRSRKSRHRLLQRFRTTVDHPTDNAPLDHATQGEAAQKVRNALSALSQAEREVLEIAYYEGLSQSEIANRLSLPLGTVKTRSRQGLKKLRRALDNQIAPGR